MISHLQIAMAGTSGIGLVKCNDVKFPSRAQRTSKGPPGDNSPSERPRTPESKGSRCSWRKMEHATKVDSEDAWNSWMEQSADLGQLDSDELRPELILRQAQELGAAAAKRSTALEALVDAAPPAHVHLSVSPVQPALPAFSESVREADRTDELLSMLREQVMTLSKEEDFQRRIDCLRDKADVVPQNRQSIDADLTLRLQQLKILGDSRTGNAPGPPRSGTGADRSTADLCDAVLHESAGMKQLQSGVAMASAQHSVEHLNKHAMVGAAAVDTLLAELRDGAECMSSSDAARTIVTASSDLDEFEAQQVQQLVERAMLSDDLSMSPTQIGDLDDCVRAQWYNEWTQSERSGGMQSDPCQDLGTSAVPGSSHLDDEVASVTDRPNDVERIRSDSDLKDCCTQSHGALEWSQEDLLRPEVQEADDLARKLQTSLLLPSHDQRRHRWLGAIAIRSAERGESALHDGDIKLASAMNKICLAASAQGFLQAGDKVKIDAFCLHLHKAQAARAARIMAHTSKQKARQSQREDLCSGFPDAPGPPAKE
eukprot:jgi/Ulvmu1/5154/UM021_0171.1